jgi:hypothetical protein
MWVGMWIGMWIGTWVGTWIGRWVGMWVGMWIVMWVGMWIGMWIGCSLLAYSSKLVPSKRLHTITSLAYPQWTRHPNHKAQQLLANTTIPVHKGFEFVHGDRPSGLFLGFGSSSLPPLSFLYLIARCSNASFLVQERAFSSAPLFFYFRCCKSVARV